LRGSVLIKIRFLISDSQTRIFTDLHKLPFAQHLHPSLNTKLPSFLMNKDKLIKLLISITHSCRIEIFIHFKNKLISQGIKETIFVTLKS